MPCATIPGRRLVALPLAGPSRPFRWPRASNAAGEPTPRRVAPSRTAELPASRSGYRDWDRRGSAHGHDAMTARRSPAGRPPSCRAPQVDCRGCRARRQRIERWSCVTCDSSTTGRQEGLADALTRLSPAVAWISVPVTAELGRTRERCRWPSGPVDLGEDEPAVPACSRPPESGAAPETRCATSSGSETGSLAAVSHRCMLRTDRADEIDVRAVPRAICRVALRIAGPPPTEHAIYADLANRHPPTSHMI